MRYIFFAIGVAGSSLCLAHPTEHPNVVVIITDDQGYGDLFPG